jgi:hypothetical protein
MCAIENRKEKSYRLKNNKFARSPKNPKTSANNNFNIKCTDKKINKSIKRKNIT